MQTTYSVTSVGAYLLKRTIQPELTPGRGLFVS
jgi:hypothetical protein